MPYVSEHVRRQLARGLQRFSIAAFIAFGLVVIVLFRSPAVLLGTMVSGLTACFGTFLVRAFFGLRTDILAPNLWMIAFVLTLSHVVYLTAHWRRRMSELGSHQAVAESVLLTRPAAAWSLAANLLGFASLMFVSAKPLRWFGISGGIAAVLAVACAYGLHPIFLRAAHTGSDQPGPVRRRLERIFTTRHPHIAALTIVASLVLAPFAWRVETDPSLPSYFAPGERIRTGLEAIDEAGGSSLLDIVVADRAREPLDDGRMFRRLRTLQERLEKHPDVGSALSVALLMAEAERPWYAFLFSWETRLERLDSPEHDRIGRTFLSADRNRSRFILRRKPSASKDSSRC